MAPAASLRCAGSIPSGWLAACIVRRQLCVSTPPTTHQVHLPPTAKNKSYIWHHQWKYDAPPQHDLLLPTDSPDAMGKLRQLNTLDTWVKMRVRIWASNRCQTLLRTCHGQSEMREALVDLAMNELKCMLPRCCEGRARGNRASSARGTTGVLRGGDVVVMASSTKSEKLQSEIVGSLCGSARAARRAFVRECARGIQSICAGVHAGHTEQTQPPRIKGTKSPLLVG